MIRSISRFYNAGMHFVISFCLALLRNFPLLLLSRGAEDGIKRYVVEKE